MVLSAGRAGPGSGSELVAGSQPLLHCQLQKQATPWSCTSCLAPCCYCWRQAPAQAPGLQQVCPHPALLSPVCLLQPGPGQKPLWAQSLTICWVICGCTRGNRKKRGGGTAFRIEGQPSGDRKVWAVPTLNLLRTERRWLPGREVARGLAGSKEPLACTLNPRGWCPSRGGAPHSHQPPAQPEAGCWTLSGWRRTSEV